MNAEMLAYEIRARKLDFLVNKLRTSNWGIMLMALAFSYFYWESGPKDVLLLWLCINLAITAARALFVYPRYDRTTITPKNVDAWLNWFTLTLAVTGLVWGVALPFFFVPDDSLLLLVLMFSFFTLMVSATVTLASHMPGFIAFTLPLIASISALFFYGGERVYIEFSIAFILFSLFTAHFYRSTHREITELITLQVEKQNLAEELEKKKSIAEENRLIAERSIEEKNRFLAAASHDLRQPLHASGLLISMLDKHISSDKGEGILSDIQAANQALTHSFNSLMDMSKLDAGVIEVSLAHIELKQILESIKNEFSQQLLVKGVEFSVAAEDIVVYCDPQLLTRVIRNIVSNAVKYTDQGKVSIAIDKPSSGEQVGISITDTGIGIPESERESIFSEYYQLHNPERDREKGFGLGLAIVKRLCDLLDLNFELKSELGNGTQFCLWVPMGAPSLVESVSIKEVIALPLKGIEVLVIDDDKTVLNSMTRLLESWACTVIGVQSAEEAMHVITDKPFKPNVVIADYRLKGHETGVEVCRKIIAALANQPEALIITGDTSPDRLQEVKKSRFPILHKPVTPGELRSFLHRVCFR